MRTAFVLGVGVLLTTGLLLAQDHQNSTEKVVKTDVTFSTDVRVGTTMLKAGEYQITCDRQTITFRSADTGKTLKMPCKGPELSHASDQTETHLVKDASGVYVVKKLLVKGSTVEHTFN